MSATIDGNGRILLVGDNLGWSGARRELTPPVAAFDGMSVVFRAWWDSYTGTGQDNTDPGWDTVACLGLGFTDVFPSVSGGANGFFGIRSSLNAGNMSSAYGGDIFGNGKAGVFLRNPSVQSGFFGTTGTTEIAPNNSQGRNLPANPTVGAEFTGVWTIKRGSSTNDIRLSLGYNMESLSRENITQARTSLATVWNTLNVVVTDGTYWRDNGDMNFPTWFLMKNPSPTIGRGMVLDHVVVEYFRYNELI